MGKIRYNLLYITDIRFFLLASYCRPLAGEGKEKQAHKKVQFALLKARPARKLHTVEYNPRHGP